MIPVIVARYIVSAALGAAASAGVQLYAESHTHTVNVGDNSGVVITSPTTVIEVPRQSLPLFLLKTAGTIAAQTLIATGVTKVIHKFSPGNSAVNPATLIANPATSVANPATSVANPATSVANLVTSVANPATSVANHVTSGPNLLPITSTPEVPITTGLQAVQAHSLRAHPIQSSYAGTQYTTILRPTAPPAPASAETIIDIFPSMDVVNQNLEKLNPVTFSTKNWFEIVRESISSQIAEIAEQQEAAEGLSSAAMDTINASLNDLTKKTWGELEVIKATARNLFNHIFERLQGQTNQITLFSKEVESVSATASDLASQILVTKAATNELRNQVLATDVATTALHAETENIKQRMINLVSTPELIIVSCGVLLMGAMITFAISKQQIGFAMVPVHKILDEHGETLMLLKAKINAINEALEKLPTSSDLRLSMLLVLSLLLASQAFIYLTVVEQTQKTLKTKTIETQVIKPVESTNSSINRI